MGDLAFNIGYELRHNTARTLAIGLVALAVLGFVAVGAVKLLGGDDGGAAKRVPFTSCSDGLCLDHVYLPKSCSAATRELCEFRLEGTVPASAPRPFSARLVSPSPVKSGAVQVSGDQWETSGTFMCLNRVSGAPVIARVLTGEREVLLTSKDVSVLHCS